MFLYILLAFFSCKVGNSEVQVMVWTGVTDWENIDAEYINLAFYVPWTIPSSLEDIFYLVTGDTFPNKELVLERLDGSTTKAISLTIGGSAANSTGWKRMEESGVSAWKELFLEMRNVTGLNGIDWDLEHLPNSTDTDFYTFLDTLSSELIDEGFSIGYTLVGYLNHADNPPDWFYETTNVDYWSIMLYDDFDMWDDWQYFATEFREYHDTITSKLFYALYPAPPLTGEFNYEAISDAMDFVEEGEGIGISLWCYGGWLGDCSNSYKASIKSCVESIVENGSDGCKEDESDEVDNDDSSSIIISLLPILICLF